MFRLKRPDDAADRRNVREAGSVGLSELTDDRLRHKVNTLFSIQEVCELHDVRPLLCCLLHRHPLLQAA